MARKSKRKVVEESSDEEEEEEEFEAQPTKKKVLRRAELSDSEEEEEEEKEEETTTKMVFHMYKDALTSDYDQNDPVLARVNMMEEIVTEKDLERGKKLDEGEMKNLISKMVRYLLFKGSKKLPILRSKLTAEVMGNYKKNKITVLVLAEAQKILRQVWGYDLVSAPRPSQTEDFKGQQKDMLFLVCKERSPSRSALLAVGVKDSENVERGFLMAIFGIMAGAPDWKLKETELFRYLHALDEKIPQEPSNKKITVDGLYGDVNDILEKFIKQGFLSRENNAQDDRVFSLGPRALVDVGRNQILQFQADVCEDKNGIDSQTLKDMQDNAQINDEESEDEEEEQVQKATSKKSQETSTKKQKQDNSAANKKQATSTAKKSNKK